MLGSLGFPEVLLIFVIVLFVFGTRRLGDLGKGLGEGIRNFKRALKDADKEEEKGDRSDKGA
jgi:sec-independent protein translocase protein TatA